MTEPIDIRAGRNAAQLVALSALVGAMPGVLRAKGALSHAELRRLAGARRTRRRAKAGD